MGGQKKTQCVLSSMLAFLVILNSSEGFTHPYDLSRCTRNSHYPCCLSVQVAENSSDLSSSTITLVNSEKVEKKKDKSKRVSQKSSPKASASTLANRKTVNNQKSKKSKGKKVYKPRVPLKQLKLGSLIDGKVVQLKPYGAFIQTKYDIKDKGWALLHVSQIQHNRIDDITKVLKVGQKIKPRVITIDYQTKEVGVSLRAKREARTPVSEMNIGDEIEGTIKSIEPYGAFVDIGCTSDALLHISRISPDKISDINDHVKKGEKVTVHLIAVDKKKNTLAVSMLPEINDRYLDRRKRYRGTIEKEELSENQ